MENDVLKNKIAPWQEKGRWYHGLWSYTTNAIVSDKTDKYIIDNFTSGSAAGFRYLIPLKKEIRIIDIKFDAYGDIASDNSYNINFRYKTGSIKGVSIGPSTMIDGFSEFWLFIVEK